MYEELLKILRGGHGAICSFTLGFRSKYVDIFSDGIVRVIEVSI